MVIPQQATESFTTLDRAFRLADVVTRVDDHVSQALVIPFAMVMLEIGRDGTS
jgi:hypothetical protein